MIVKGINHLSIVARNGNKTANFLKDVVGCAEHQHAGWFRLSGCSTLIHVIEIEDASVPPGEDMFHYYNHNALEVDNLKEFAQRCLRANCEPFQMDHEGQEMNINDQSDLLFGLRTVFVRDPDGNLWEFAQKGFSWDQLWM